MVIFDYKYIIFLGYSNSLAVSKLYFNNLCLEIFDCEILTIFKILENIVYLYNNAYQ